MVPLRLEHREHSWHELEGGNDLYGSRPQCGVTLLQAEMNGLSFKSGYETAWDEVSNENLVPELVHAARALEMEYFHKLGVYEKVPVTIRWPLEGRSLVSDGLTLAKRTPLMSTTDRGSWDVSST